MKIYELLSNMAVELDEDNVRIFEEDLASLFVQLVEEHGGRCGGGFELIVSKGQN